MRFHKLYSPYYINTKDNKIQGEREKEVNTHTLSFRCPIHKNIAYTCACPSGGKSIFFVLKDTKKV